MLNSPVWRGSRSRFSFCVGLLLGALATAAGLLLVGSLLRLAMPAVAIRWMLLAAVVALVARELDLVSFWLPQNKRLVPEHVNRHGRVFGPLQFGFEMGTSLRTYTPSALPHAVALTVAFLASPLATVVVGVGFGLGRATMSLGNLHYSKDNSWDLAWLDHERLLRWVLAAGFAGCVVVVLVTA
jgi:hypothetical protein